MDFKFKRLLLTLLFVAHWQSASSQFFLYSEAPIDIDIHFTRHSLEAEAGQSFFNVLKIKNNANRAESFTLNITSPPGWRVIGPEKIELQLAPFDSTLIPIRVAISSKVRGDIGYSVIASLTDSRGNTIKNEYCFVKIPRKTDLNFRFLNRVSFIDPVSGISDFSILVKNQGNREEPISFIFDGKQMLGIGRQNQNQFAIDIVIPPYTDSTFTFPVELKASELFGKTLFNLEATVTSIDTTLKTNLWFRRIESMHKNSIPSSEKPLVVELTGQGLLDANRKPIASINLEGKILFKGENDIYYYYKNFASEKTDDFYKFTQMHIGANLNKWKIELGDNYRLMEGNTIGRGIFLSYSNKKFKSELLANKDQYVKNENLGGTVYYYINPTFHIKTGGTYSRNLTNDFNSKLGFIGTGVSFLTNHRLNATLAFNQVIRELNGESNHNEFGGEINYNSKIGKFYNTLRLKYGSPLYYSPVAGRFDGYASIQFYHDLRHRTSVYYSENSSTRLSINGNTITNRYTSENRELKFEHLLFVTPSVQVFGGPGFENYKWEGLNSFPAGEFYSSLGYKIYFGSRIRNSAGTLTISPRFELARVNVLNNPYLSVNPTNPSSEWFNYQFFNINVRTKYLNVIAFYTSGPRSVFDQLSFLFYEKPVRKLQFMPAFDAFIYKDIVRAYLGLSYSNDIAAKSTYSNITGQFYWYLPKNWRIHALSVYSLQNRKTPQESTETYQNFYLEAGIRKEFDFNQPRVKFYDVDLIFFKDFNGNGAQDINEPGVKNVLVTISKEFSSVVGTIPGDFYTTELLSDNLGRVRLERIPEGRYSINYNPVGKDAGNFSKALEDVDITIKKDGPMYFPFVEKNKVFGKIILNRSRLSGLGRVDVSNVRITATDSQGRSYSTLTDKDGSFVLFAPITDEYILTMNNIFYENFDLRQNNFRVQFNGYKQFEVNYVFDEKVRRINFAASPGGETQVGVLQVRRTTLSGTVKDANSQTPIRARVNLINTQNNTVAISTFSSATSGDYTLSFIASDNYLLEVLADDYWYMSENLTLNQITTFMNISRDVLLKPISVGSKVELNIRFDANSSYLAPESVAELNRLIRLLKNNPTIRLQIQGHCDDIEALQKPAIALERANAVVKFLIENGFSNLDVRSFVNTVPIQSNDTEDGRTRNRRVEVEVISK